MGRTPKQEAQEACLAGSACCAVLIGSAGLSGWQNEQIRIAIQTRAEDAPDFPVIPVLLPGADLPERGGLPPFLRRYVCVDFRHVADHVPTRAEQIQISQHLIFRATAMEEDFLIAFARR